LRYAVIGIGLNVNHRRFPPSLSALATSLYLESDRHYDREPLLAALLRHMDEEMKELRNSWLGAPRNHSLERRFTAASTWVTGKRVKVDEQGGYTGTTRGLDHHGFLQVLGDDGVVRTVLSGGVRSA
jgi:BirA family biotin operon repressor/biotin-[acetyl-CoA-carboxylase] ligase